MVEPLGWVVEDALALVERYCFTPYLIVYNSIQCFTCQRLYRRLPNMQ